jgi:hypothetical protein
MDEPPNEGRAWTVERLQALVEMNTWDMWEKGRQDGGAWARDSASPRELLNIERHFDENAGNERLPLYWIQRLLDPKGERWLTREDLGETFHTRSFNGLEYVRGFLTGALEVWNDVAVEVIPPF